MHTPMQQDMPQKPFLFIYSNRLTKKMQYLQKTAFTLFIINRICYTVTKAEVILHRNFLRKR